MGLFRFVLKEMGKQRKRIKYLARENFYCEKHFRPKPEILEGLVSRMIA